LLTGGSYPTGITSGPDGNLWFTERFGNNIGRITPAGVITEFPIPTGGSEPDGGITSGPDGNLWFTEGTGNRIGRITTAGVITEFLVPTGGSFPIGITLGPDGNLWFAEAFAIKIGRITTSGTITEYPIPGGGQPLWITAGPDGNLWFTDQVDSKIGRITTSGLVTEFATPTANSLPQYITTGPDGNLWFAEELANQIGKATTLLTLSVSAKMDLYRAGGYSDHSDGSAPAEYSIQPGTVPAITFSSITGLWTCSSINPVVPPYGPDGTTTGGCNNGTGRHINNPIGPFSGYDTTDFSGALAGMFLADSLPTSPPPPLRFYVSDSSQGGIQTNFTSLSPVVGQVFFIGDGLTGTGTGATQVFQVPPTASRLYLGYVDSCNATVPGCYGDNSGSMAVSLAASCGYSISPMSQSFGAGGGTGQVVVTTLLPPSSCGFSATSDASWIVIPPATGGV